MKVVRARQRSKRVKHSILAKADGAYRVLRGKHARLELSHRERLDLSRGGAFDRHPAHATTACGVGSLFAHSSRMSDPKNTPVQRQKEMDHKTANRATHLLSKHMCTAHRDAATSTVSSEMPVMTAIMEMEYLRPQQIWFEHFLVTTKNK